MDWDRNRRFDDHRGGESYRPGSSRGYSRRSRSPPRIRSPRLVADTWVPSTGRTYNRVRSRSPPPFRRRSSRSPPFYSRDSFGPYVKSYSSSRRFSPRREGRPRSPAQLSRRPRSPYGEDRDRDTSWSQGTPKRPRDSPPFSRDAGIFRKERHPPSADQHARSGSPSRHILSSEEDQRTSTTPRPRSPFYGGRREPHLERFSRPRRRSPSPRGLAPKRTSAPGSVSNSRRSSPHTEKAGIVSADPRGRSPATNHLPSRCLSRDSGPPSSQDERTAITRHRVDESKGKSGPFAPEQASARNHPDLGDSGSLRAPDVQGRPQSYLNPPYSGNIPNQPKAFSVSNSPLPPGPPHGPKTLPAQNRASNISLLSAPTRPRGSSGFKEAGWASSPIRRGPVPVGTHGTPTGPRSSHAPPASSAEAHRHHSYRQSSVTGTTYTHTQRYANHLAGLRSIIPGGKLLPSEIDTNTEKTLSQLDSDKGRLFEQITESQKLKRAGLREWDKFDRESSICALKSELAEGHLQCIADTEGTHARATF
ncbi:hypothetical protein ARAM_000734 [Aspergillus rambellii]|uniref:Serine/arginine repetitive matrix protein n=1 Tax=Aspergillus rambellii TaxID=308745 RepID=A0A0F8U8H8_9EURO|nr:hypothetical protein ARAM_000734 [Aspergillus rambellii]